MKEFPLSKIGFDIPDHWTDFSVLTFVSAEGEDLQANVVVMYDVLDIDLETYVKEQQEDIAEEVEKFNAIKQEAYEVAGQKGIMVEQSFFAPDEGEDIYQMQLYLPYDKWVYMITCSQAKEEFEQVRSTFENILKSINL